MGGDDKSIGKARSLRGEETKLEWFKGEVRVVGMSIYDLGSECRRGTRGGELNLVQQNDELPSLSRYRGERNVRRTPPRNVSLDGKEYSIRSGFLAQDKLMRELEFECEDENDAGHWVQAFCLIESVQLLSNVPDFAGQESGEGGEGADAQGVASSRYPHESEYGGGKNYVSAPYIGGKSIFEPQVLFDKDATNSDSEWRCWPSGPLPPNDRIIGSDQNMCSWSLDQGVRVDATESNGRVGIGIGLKQAHQGVEISEGKFGVQISEISSGGTAEAARQVVLSIKLVVVRDRAVVDRRGNCESETSSYPWTAGPAPSGTRRRLQRSCQERRGRRSRSRWQGLLWAQPNWWLQLGVVRFKCTLRRAKMKPPRQAHLGALEGDDAGAGRCSSSSRTNCC
eukprot:760670-Hanusia_phi.AAC.6